MIKSIFHVLYALSVTMILFSCHTPSTIADVPYFQNSREVFADSAAHAGGIGAQHDMLIRPKDALNVFVFSSNAVAIASLNVRERRAFEIGGSLNDNTRSGFYNYLVDNDGTIDYPQLGRLHVAGMTVEQAAKMIHEGLSPTYNADGSLVVNVRIANLYVSVLGEVKNPTTFDVERPRLTVLEALAQAGDLTIYGKRDNVKILRQQDNGDYEVHELDLRDARVLESPYYYLQQRDIVYVEPNEVMAQNSLLGRTRQLWIRGIQITISLGSLLYRVLQ
jgi:polysaccharide export outer membrane protein